MCTGILTMERNPKLRNIYCEILFVSNAKDHYIKAWTGPDGTLAEAVYEYLERRFMALSDGHP